MTYDQFPDIEIPEFLSGPQWEDQSWHNDVYPHSGYSLQGDEQVWVWVAPEKREDREYPDGSRFTAEYTQDGQSGGTEPIYAGESAEECAEAVRKFIAQVSKSDGDRVYYFCSETCRANFDGSGLPGTLEGVRGTCGTVCDQCGSSLKGIHRPACHSLAPDCPRCRNPKSLFGCFSSCSAPDSAMVSK